MDPSVYIVGGIFLGGLFFASGVAALAWASRQGQLRDFERGATTIFDAEEPEGTQIDHFPGTKPQPRGPVGR